MHAFAEKLKEKGHRVIYWTIGDENNEQDPVKNLKEILALAEHYLDDIHEL